jgi:hypothetical protein
LFLSIPQPPPPDLGGVRSRIAEHGYVSLRASADRRPVPRRAFFSGKEGRSRMFKRKILWSIEALISLLLAACLVAFFYLYYLPWAGRALTTAL